MDKHFLKTSFAVFAAASILLFFAGCSQQPIFWAIEHEVPLSKASIIGTVYDTVGFQNKLYTANGYLYSKSPNVPPGTEWSKISIPAGLRCIGLASDSTFLYGFFNEIGSNQIFSVYSFNGTAWTVVKTGTGTPCAVFDTGGVEAYVALKQDAEQYSVSKLGKASVTALSGTSAKPFFDAAGYNGTIYFAAENGIWKEASNAITSVAGTPDSGVSGIVSNSSFLYAVTESTVHYYNGTAWKTTSPGFGRPLCLAIADSRLFIGTASGYTQVMLDSVTNIPSDSATSPGANAEAAIGSYQVRNLYAATGALAGENTYVLYASVLDTTDSARSGLWAYYSTDRAEWNRE